MPNSWGEERHRRTDMPGTQAVRVVFRSRPWSGTARAATLRAGSGSRVRPELGSVGGCVWPAVIFPQPGLAEGPLPLQRGRVKGAPRPPLSTPGSPNPRLAHGRNGGRSLAPPYRKQHCPGSLARSYLPSVTFQRPIRTELATDDATETSVFLVNLASHFRARMATPKEVPLGVLGLA